MRSIYDVVSVNTTVEPVAVAGTIKTVGSIAGTTVDTKGYSTAMIHAYMTGYPPTGASTLVFTLQESSDNSTWTFANDNTGTVIGFTLVQNVNLGSNFSPGGQAGSARIEGLGLNRKRYLRGSVSYTLSSAAVNATAYATILMGRAYAEPVRTGISNT